MIEDVDSIALGSHYKESEFLSLQFFELYNAVFHRSAFLLYFEFHLALEGFLNQRFFRGWSGHTTATGIAISSG